MSDLFYIIVNSTPYKIFAIIFIIIAIIGVIACCSEGNFLGALGCIVGAIIVLILVPVIISFYAVFIVLMLFAIIAIFWD